MKAVTPVLLMGLCSVGGFLLVHRPGSERAGERTRGASIFFTERPSESGSAGDGGAVSGEESAAGAETRGRFWKEAPKTFLELKRLLESRAAGREVGRLEVMEALGQMNAQELGAFLSQEAENPDFFRRMGFDFQFAARRFAEIAPEQAAQLWVSKAALRMQTEDLLGPWAKREPQAFAAWCLQLSPEAQKAAASALGGIAGENPDQFLALAEQLQNSPAGSSAVRAAMAALKAKLDATKLDNSDAWKAKVEQDSAAAREFASRLPEGALRTAALAQLARWPGSNFLEDPDVAGALAALPREDARRLGRDMAQNAEKLPAGVARESAFATALRDQAERDVPAATARLDSLNGTADYPAAVRGFVDATARKDPAAALQWALAIPAGNPSSPAQMQRSAALERAVGELFKQNPDAARQWVQSAPISAQEYFQLTGQKKAQ